MKYKAIFTQTIVHEFEVEAKNPDEAWNKAWDMVDERKVDLSHGECIEAGIDIMLGKLDE